MHSVQLIMEKLAKKHERMQARANYVRAYVDSASQKGVKVAHSIRVLSNKVLFLSERQLWKDYVNGKPPEKKSDNNY